MRIGIDARMYSSSFTGIGRYVYELSQHLFKIDPSNEYILFLNEPEYSQFSPPSSKVKKVLVNAPHYSLREQTRFLRKLNKEKLDLMHFTHFNAPILYNRPSVVTIHDLTLSFYPGKKMTRWYHRMGYDSTITNILKKSRKVIAVSQNTKKDLLELFDLPEEKIAVIYEGASPEFKKIEGGDRLAITKQKHGLDSPFLLYTGVWRDHKNIVNLLRAFHLLRNKYSANLKLVITGKADPTYPEVKENIEKLGIADSVLLTGLVPEGELIDLYNLATLYVFPSFYEGFGLPILEAFACETPVVASNTACIPEICGEENAVFFDPGDPENMAEAINSTLNNPELQRKLIQRGKERLKNFSWGKMAQETLELYNNI